MPLRTITYNVLACTGYWSRDGRERRARAYTPAAAARRFADALGRHAPDLLTFAEAPAPALVRDIARRLGMRCVFFPSPQAWPGALCTSDVIEEAAPLTPEDETLFTRHAGRALLRRPDGSRLAVYSAHLHPSDHELRAREQDQLLAAIHRDLEAGRDVVLQGDLNHRPEMPEYERWLVAGLRDAMAAAPPLDERAHTFRSDLPMARLDYVWTAGSIAREPTTAEVLRGVPFSAGLGEDPPLSDHLPVIAVIGDGGD